MNWKRSYQRNEVPNLEKFNPELLLPVYQDISRTYLIQAEKAQDEQKWEESIRLATLGFTALVSLKTKKPNYDSSRTSQLFHKAYWLKLNALEQILGQPVRNTDFEI